MPRKKQKRSRGVPSGAGAESATQRLKVIRDEITALDRTLMDVLNRRADLVVEVGKVKRAVGMPVYTPHRESEVLDRALAASSGVLPQRTVEAIFRELMSGSFALQQPLRVGYLGPAGSHSHVAAVRHFGGSVDFEDLHEIAGVFTEVQRGHVQCGLVPIENSTGGGIAETMDAFRDGRGRGGRGEVVVCAEVQLEVHHALLANCPPRAVQRILSKPEVFIQCRKWLATQYPKAELIPMPSSSRAAEVVASEARKAERTGGVAGVAAIGSELAGQLYGLGVLFPRIEDHADNITRFFVISKTPAQRSGDDKTSVMFTTADKPGALVHVLQAFEHHGINLTHIEKRPSGRRNWHYTFFVDARGHTDDSGTAAALAEAKGHCHDLAILGSYPRSKRIL